MNLRINNSLSAVIVTFFTLFILVDMLNGVLIRNGYFSISFIYKFSVLILVSLYIFMYRDAIYLLLLGLILALYFIVHTYIVGDVLLVMKGMDFLVKFISVLIFYLFFRSLVRKGQQDRLFLIAKLSCFFIGVNIVLGKFGLGYPMYGHGEDAIGTRGFIYAGNEIGVAFVVSGAIIMMRLLGENNYFKFLLFGLFLLSVGNLMATKVPIFGTLLIIFSFPLLKSIQSTKNWKISKRDFIYTSLTIIVVPFCALYAIYFALYESNLIVRIKFFSERYDPLTAIMSGRTPRIEEAISVFSTQYSTLEKIFGTGIAGSTNFPVYMLTENDFTDFLMSYGIFGVGFLYSAVLYFLVKLSIFNGQNLYAPYIGFTILLILAISLTAGHVFNSGTAGFLLAILFALTDYKNRAL